VARAETAELERREQAFRGEAKTPELHRRIVIIVDDGLATGASMRAAIEAVRRLGPKKIVVAVPVAAESTYDELSSEVDEVACVLTPDPFVAVGHWYETFDQTSDEEVRRYLTTGAKPQQPAQAVESSPNAAATASQDASHFDIHLLIEGVSLEGSLVVPETPHGVVLFAHGSGSSRFSPRNQRVARRLNQAGFATLLFDMLTAAEEKIDARSGRLRFDIHLLAERLFHATDWIRRHRRLGRLPLGYFGASTGAAAALVAAAQRSDVAAIVSRGGRPDLAGDALPQVYASVLLIVGGADTEVLQLNREAHRQLIHAHSSELQIVPRATHFFEEPGALDDVAERAAQWFVEHLAEVAHAHRA
jgi:putative phosphoribosyl transferase